MSNGHTRHDQGKTADRHESIVPGLWYKSHHRSGPPSPLRPLPVKIFEQTQCIIQEPDPVPAVVNVTDSSVPAAFLGLLLLSIAWVRRFN